MIQPTESIGGLSFTDVNPCALRARDLCRCLDLDLLASLQYLAEVCASQTDISPTILSGVHERALRSLSASTDARLPGALVASYSLLQNAVRQSRLPLIEHRIGRMNAIRLIGFPTRVVALGDAELSNEESDDLKEVFRNEMEASGQNSSIMDPTDRVLVQRSKQAVCEALDAVRTVAPELHAEIQHLITDILIIDSSKTNAASSFQTFGVIFLKTLKPFQTWTTYVEHIVHEAAHHLLFAIFAKGNVFASGNHERFSSPLRSDPRPLDAVFHAMFVLARIIYILRKIADSTVYPRFERTATYSFFNPAPLIEQFRDAYATVLGAAKLTPEGLQFLDGIRSFAEAHAFAEQPLLNRT